MNKSSHWLRLIKGNVISSFLLLVFFAFYVTGIIPIRFFLIMTALLGYFIIQSVFVHINYYRHDKHTHVKIEKEKISIKRNGEQKVLVIHSIEEIELVGRFFDDHLSWIPVQRYYYTKFHLRDNDGNLEINYLSCLIFSREQLYSLNKNIKLINTSFPFIDEDE